VSHSPSYRASPLPSYAAPLRTLPEHLVPERSGVVSWWSNVKREGEWVVPRNFRAFACMGHVELDLTSAQLGSGISEMELNCVMGGVTLIVPPDIRVLCDGDAIVGSFDVERVGKTTPPVDAPTLRVSGTAYFGGVTIRIVDPNAPGFIAKLKAGWASLNE